MADKPKHRPIWEYVTGLVLTTAGVATSWSGYQAALWDGIESESYSKAMIVRLDAAQEDGEAGQMHIIDMNVFTQWLDAYARHDVVLEKFYRERFRPEFVPAFEKWIASRPVHNPDALPTPFVQPEYISAQHQRAKEMNAASVALFKAGEQANVNSDNYAKDTVVFGTAMFFAGIAQQFDSRRVTLGLLLVASLMIIVGVYRLIIYPLAS